MTAVVGIETGSGVVIGGDSAITEGDYIGRAAEPKVWYRRGVLYGAAGNLDQLQALRYSFDYPQYRRRQSPERFMGASLAPALRAFLMEFLGGGRALGDDKEDPIDILVGVGGRLFVFDGSAYTPKGPEWAIGSGSDAARAALLHCEGDPRHRVRVALETSSKVCLSVAGPFHILEK